MPADILILNGGVNFRSQLALFSWLPVCMVLTFRLMLKEETNSEVKTFLQIQKLNRRTNDQMVGRGPSQAVLRISNLAEIS